MKLQYLQYVSSAACIFVVLCFTSARGSNQIIFLAWFYFLLESTKEEQKKVTWKKIKCKKSIDSVKNLEIMPIAAG